MSQTKPKNKYFVCIINQAPVEWNPCSAELMFGVDSQFFTTFLKSNYFTYFSKVFAAMEEHLDVSGITFYLAWSDVSDLPTYGKDVIAIVVNDEWCRIPKYFYKVKATFKCYGIEQTIGCNFIANPSYLNFLTTIQFVRNWFIRLPSIFNYISKKNKSVCGLNHSQSNIYDIPLGYANQLDLPIKDLDERMYDISFLGSVSHSKHTVWSPKYWMKTPKQFSRERMIASLQSVILKYPNLKVELSLTDSFSKSMGTDASIYSEKMMNTKICLIPRGTSFETFRFFEAIRYGCIAITEALPSRWFYTGSPAIQLSDWRDLETTIQNLLSDPQLMRQKSQETLNWWKTKCSEESLGYYMAHQINQLEQ